METGEFRKIVRWLCITIFLTLITVKYVVQKIDVYGDSMEPGLSDGDSVLIDKMIYRFQEPKRYDMVVFKYLYREDQYYIKRIIGLPGETVQIIDGTVWIDGKPCEENYGNGPVEKAKRAENPVLLGADEYFVLGDNRNHSSDSRDSDIGNIASGQILGKVALRLFPLKDFEIIKHQ